MASQIFAYIFMALWALAFFVMIFQQTNSEWRPTTKGRMRRMSRQGWQYRDMTTGEISQAKDDYDARQY